MNILSQLFTFALGGASIYFFYNNNFVVAVILFTWFLSRLFGYNLKRIFEGISHSEVERHSNIVLELKINIAAILNHESVSNLFDKLQGREKAPMRSEFNFQDKTKWIDQMIENYKKLFNNDNDFTQNGARYLWESSKYNIKNNLLWENGQIDFNDSIEHEVFIPYEYEGAEKEKERFWHDIGSGIRIRVVVVNGLIKVQIGNFDKESSPQIYKDGFLAAYKTWETITTFPLMYVSQSIPTNYLNLSMYATDSYKNLLKPEPSKDWTKDWKQLIAEIQDYNYLKTQFASDAPANKRFQRIYKKFYTKSLSILAAEKFIDPNKRENDNSWPEPGWMKDNNTHYLNNYLSVFIADYKDAREKNEKYYLTDFYEEHP